MMSQPWIPPSNLISVPPPTSSNTPTLTLDNFDDVSADEGAVKNVLIEYEVNSDPHKTTLSHNRSGEKRWLSASKNNINDLLLFSTCPLLTPYVVYLD